MSASKFFRNFLAIPPMGTKESSCHPPREKLHQNDDSKMHISQAFPAPESKCKAETNDPLIIANGCQQRQGTVSRVASTADQCQNTNDDLGLQDLRLNPLGLVGTITTKNIESSLCDTEEEGRVKANAATRGKEIKSESAAEHEHSSSANTESITTDVDPMEFSNLQATTCESLKRCKTEEELEEGEGIFDEPFQNYVNTLNVATRTNYLEDSHRATSFNGEQQKHLNYVPLVSVSFPEATEKLISFRDSASVEQTQNFICVQRLSTVLEKANSSDRSEGVNLIMANGWDIQNQNANCGSNSLKPVGINNKGSTSETTASENVNSSTFAIERCDVESSTGSPSEKTNIVLRSSKTEAAEASDDECSSIAASNTEMYDEANCQDVEISEEETQDLFFKTGVNDLPASVNVQFQVLSQRKLNKNIETQEKTNQDHLLSLNNCPTSVDPGAALVNDRTVFASKDVKNPFSCRFCGIKTSTCKDAVLRHIRQHHDENPLFSCEFCGKHFGEQFHLTRHLKTHSRKEISEDETQDVVIRTSVNEIPASVDVQLQVPSQPKLNKKNKTVGSNTHMIASSGDNCFVLLERLQDNSRNVEINTHSFSLEDNHVQAQSNNSTTLNRLAESFPGSVICLQSVLKKTFQRSRDNLCNGIVPESKVSIMRESRISKITKTKTNLSQPKENSSKSVKRKRISLRAGIVYQNEISAPDGPQSCHKAKASLCTDYTQVAREVSSPPSRLTFNSFSKLPFVVSLVTDQDFSSATDMDKPFACVLCSKAVFVPDAQPHGQKQGFSSMFCYICLDKLAHPEQQRFSCNICCVSFRAINHLLSHSKAHNREGLRIAIMCYICKKVLTRVYAVKKHMTSHPVETSFSFPVEKKVPALCISQCSTTKQTLLSSDHSGTAKRASLSFISKAKHRPSTTVFTQEMATTNSNLPPGSTLVSDRGIYRIKNEEKPFACGFCGKTYSKKHSVHGHIAQQHDEKRFSCEFCGKHFALVGDLLRHVTMHTQEKPFACDQCGMRFRLQSFLRRHKFSHSEERSFSCNECNKSFKTTGVLATHRQSHKKDERGASCGICKRVFSNPHTLKHHMRTHTEEQPFKCSLCHKQFRMKIKLRYHMNTHSGKKKHADKLCSLCGKSVTASYMPTHMRMHSGEKPFECNICFKRFPKKTNLEGHIRSHTGEKPFACSGCDKRYALYSNMVTHKRKCVAISENR